MGVGVRQRAAIDRLEAEWRAHVNAPELVPRAAESSKLGAYPELDCLRSWLSEETTANAQRRAAIIGTGADRVLVSAGILDEEIYLRALADALALEFETFAGLSRESCPLGDERLVDAPKNGLLPLQTAGGLVFVMAPRGIAARQLCEFIARNPQRAHRFRLTTAARLQQFVTENAAAAIAERATGALAKTWPALSAGPAQRPRLSLMPALTAGAIGLLALLVASDTIATAIQVALSLVFLAWIVLRIVGLLIERQPQPRLRRIPDRELPVYTIMVALYREAAAVDGLVAALRRLDYPGVMAQAPQDIRAVAA